MRHYNRPVYQVLRGRFDRNHDGSCRLDHYQPENRDRRKASAREGYTLRSGEP